MEKRSTETIARPAAEAVPGERTMRWRRSELIARPPAAASPGQMTMRPRSAGLVALLVLGATLSRPASAAPRAELETFLGGGLSGAGYAPGLGALSLDLGGGTRVGFPLGEHTVLMTGLEVHGSGAGGSGPGWAPSRWWSLTVPLELKLYLVRPAAEKLVPLVRLGAAYARASGVMGNDDEYVSHRVQGTGCVGVQYFFSERFALGMDAGLTYGQSYSSASGASALASEIEAWYLDAAWRLGMLLRI